ncbi:unnamed protein product, partial [Prorocentrum cordatum]
KSRIQEGPPPRPRAAPRSASRPRAKTMVPQGGCGPMGPGGPMMGPGGPMPGMPGNTMLSQVQMAQMAATQRNMPGAFQGGYTIYSQGCGGVPHGGGCGYGGQMGGCADKGAGRGQGDGAKGKGRGKGKGKGKFGGGKLGGAPPAFGGLSDAAADAAAAGDPRKQIELAQRRAKLRDRSAISQAQRSAQQRFEKDLLDRVQGNWVDASDSSVCYEVEGSLCAVSGGDNTRTFRNRLGVTPASSAGMPGDSGTTWT